jgi:hypothetical protein
MRLWKRFEGEPFLINPHLVSVFNPTKGGSMARGRDSKGRFLSKRRTARNPRKKRARRNDPGPRRIYAVARRRNEPNPRKKRRTYRRNAYLANPRQRRAYRRNPPVFLGIDFTEAGYAAAGFIAPSFLEGFIQPMLPVTLTGTPLGKYAIKIGVVLGLSYAARKMLGQEAGKYITIGGVTYVIASAIRDFMPTLYGGFSGYMNPGSVRALPRALPKFGNQPNLGVYAGSYQTAMAPSRLQPEGRF